MAEAALKAITLASGQAPSNMTLLPTFSTSSIDGSITITFRIDSILSKIVNTTISISAATYAADPTGSTMAAVKSATGSVRTRTVADSLTQSAQQASESVCALINATKLSSSTGELTPSALVSRISNVVQLNSSSIKTTSICEKVENAVLSEVFGTTLTTNISAATSATANSLPMSELLMSGGMSALIVAVLVFLIGYFFLNRRAKAARAALESAAKKSSIYQQNPMMQGLNRRNKPIPPQGIPPKHAYTSYHDHVDKPPPLYAQQNYEIASKMMRSNPSVASTISTTTTNNKSKKFKITSTSSTTFNTAIATAAATANAFSTRNPMHKK